MNETALELGMKDSKFAVAHGMHNDNNYSTALDIAKLSCHAMKLKAFRQIVVEQTRETRSQNFPGHIYKWENTNYLLKEGFDGIKTGITPTAGPCLAASIKKDDIHVAVIVLSCCSMDSRWYEVPKIVSWGVKKMQKIKTSTLRPKIKKKILKSITYI